MQENLNLVERLNSWSKTYSSFMAASKRNQKQLDSLLAIFGCDNPIDALRELSSFIVEARLFRTDLCEQYPATELLAPVFEEVSEGLVQRINLSLGANGWAGSFSNDGKSKLEITVPMLRTIVGVSIAERRDEVVDRLRDFIGQFVDDPLDDDQLNADILGVLTALLSAVQRGDIEAIRLAEYQLRGTIFFTERKTPTFRKVLDLINGVAAALTILHAAGALEIESSENEPPPALLEVIEDIEFSVDDDGSSSEEE